MLDSLTYIFTPSNFEPHGIHFRNTPILFWFLIAANVITFISYTLIPIALIYFVRKRKDLEFQWVFIFFGAFIVACGLHHLIHTISFWYPIYGAQGLIDTIMAIVSFGTFLSLLPVIPAALRLVGPKELEKLNKELSEEIRNKERIEADLRSSQDVLKQNQEVISARNAELEKLNKFMTDRELKMVELKKELDQLKTRLEEMNRRTD